MEKFAWFSLRRCLSVRSRLSVEVSMSCTSTEGMSIAVEAPELEEPRPNPKRGSERDVNDENMVY
jgi:hypothetical protein